MTSTPKKKRGRPPRVPSSLSQRQYLRWLEEDRRPAWRLHELLEMAPKAKGREKYRRALEQVSKEFNISLRTVERRAREHRDHIREWADLNKLAEAALGEAGNIRYLNYLKSEIAEGRGHLPAHVPASIRRKRP